MMQLVITGENIMATLEPKITKDHELLIRIDERLNILIDRMEKLELSMSNYQQECNENSSKITTIQNDLYGTKNTDGLIAKVEKHDKILAKALAYFTVIAVILEFIFKYVIKELIK